MTHADRAIRALLRSPWAIEESKLDEILGFVEAYASGERVSEEEARERFGATKPREVRSYGQIAVLPLYGTIVPRANLVSSYSGGTSCQQFAANLDAAVKNDDVSAIVIDADTPGGSVSGVEELARRIHSARGSKPIIAVSNYQMASAGYYLCSQADEVVASLSSETGSLGVFMIHTDISEAAARAGVKHTIIKAGRFKAEGNPYEPLGDDALIALQAEVDEFYDMFVAAVARGRGVKDSAVRNGFGQGRCLSAKRAKAEGLVDRIATLEEVIEDLRTGKRSRGRGRAATTVVSAGMPALAAAVPLLEGGELEVTAGAVVAPAAGKLDAALPYLVPIHADEDGEERTCPECGGEMDWVDESDDSRWECRDCGYREMDEVEAQAQDDTTNRDAGGAAPTVTTPPATEPALGAMENTVEQIQTTAPGTPGAGTVQDAIQGERERARQIRGVAQEHGIDAAKATAWIDAGHPVETVRGLVLEEIRARATATPNIRVGPDREGERPWMSFGEQLMAIAAAGMPGGTVDRRLQAAASGLNSGVGSDGGFLVQKQFSDVVYEKAYETGMLASRCDRIPIGDGFDGLEVPYINETSRANGSRWGGVQVYRRAEAATVTASKPTLGLFEVRLEDLMGIAYATGRLLRDAVALEAVMTRAFTSEFAFKLDDEIFRGTGAGECLGFTIAPALVTVAKEAGQTADTIVAENVMNMWARLWARSRPNAVWLYNQACEPQLQSLQIGTGTSAQLIFMPPGGISQQPYATIYGRPALPIEQASALGDLGDISVVDLSEYALIEKGGIQADQSMHVRFLYDEMTFRFVMQANGKPKWSSALTPYKGAGTLSPFVTLAARA